MKSYKVQNTYADAREVYPSLNSIFRFFQSSIHIWYLFIENYQRTEHYKLRLKRAQYPVPCRPKLLFLPLLPPKDFKSWRYSIPGCLRKHELEFQPVSRLLHLPRELRMRIYKEILGADGIYILLKDCRVYGIPCLEPVDEEHAWEKRCKCRRGWPKTRKTDDGLVMMSSFEYPKPGIGMMRLMLSCRLIQSEVHYFVYAKTTFLFHAPEPLLLFTSFLPPSTLHSIMTIHLDARRAVYEPFDTHDFETPLRWMPRSIRKAHKTAQFLPMPHRNTVHVLEDEEARKDAEFRPREPSVWGAACENLARMKGLKSLEINLTMKCFRSLGLRHHPWNLVWEDQGGSEEFVMQPLSQLSKGLAKNRGVFRVEVDWPERTEGLQGSDWVFEMKRREVQGEREGWYWLAR